MRNVTVSFFAGALCLLSSMAASQPALAQQLVRAYVLVETTPGDADTVHDALVGLGMSNCKPRVKSLWHSEVIVEVVCNDLGSLNVAITEGISGVEGVARTTTWMILKSQ
ncbi:MAG: hypothetical protein V3S27_05590 [Kiloniellales bacterium]